MTSAVRHTAVAAPLWSVIPAAGFGVRMQHTEPKQYLSLAGVAMLQRSIDAMLAVPRLAGVVVALADADDRWSALPASADQRVHRVTGGSMRAQSVAAGLERVRQLAGDEAWVLVHDAARPLVNLQDVQRLIDAVFAAGAVGGLLAVPVQDTLKHSVASPAAETVRDAGTVGSTGSGESGEASQGIEPAALTACCLDTLPRDDLWQAQTPQLFPAGVLADALQAALDGQSFNVTDEASALEHIGRQPLLVEARSPNFKITWPRDCELAEALLARQSTVHSDSSKTSDISSTSGTSNTAEKRNECE